MVGSNLLHSRENKSLRGHFIKSIDLDSKFKDEAIIVDDFFSNAYHSSTSLESFAISLYHYINTVLSIQQTVVNITFNSQQKTVFCCLTQRFTNKGRFLGNGQT